MRGSRYEGEKLPDALWADRIRRFSIGDGIAGGRRLDALQSLQAEGRLPGDHAVPCKVADGDPTELSLAENVVRQAMHPADEHEAFAALIEGGQTAAQVAVRFGTTERHVLQRMKLGRVAPKLLEAYRAEKVTLDALMAFAVSDDHKRQISVWKSLEGWQVNNARAIRGKLTDTMTDADDGTVKFVGLDAYKAAGGKVKADLFSEEVFLEDTALLDRLANAKLESEVEKLRAEGWGWVEIESDESIPAHRCRRIESKPTGAPVDLMEQREKLADEIRDLDEAIEAAYESDDADEESRLDEKRSGAQEGLDELDEKLEAYLAFDPQEMQNAGCLVSIDSDGELEIDRGLLKPDSKASASSSGDDNRFAPAKKEKPEFSQSLVADMKAYRTQAAQVEIAMHPQIAFDLLVFHAAVDVLDHFGTHEGVDVSFRQSYPRPSVEKEGLAVKRLEVIEEGLSKAWLDEEGETERFNAFRQLSDADKYRNKQEEEADEERSFAAGN